METAGICLKKHREANNISLREVSQKTKIAPIYLQHIEKDEFDKIPQGPYVKSYLSSYSQAIGCDVKKIIQLYESANREQTDAYAIHPATGSITGKNDSADPPKAQSRKPRSGFRPGNLKAGVESFAAFVAAKSASIRAAKPPAAKKPNDSKRSSKTKHHRSFRQSIGRVRQSSFSAAIRRGSTDRRTWMFAGSALCGAFLLFLAGVGFYHLFIYDPVAVTAAEAKPTSDEKPLGSSADSGPTRASAPTTDASTAADAPEGPVARHRSAEPAEADKAVSGAKSAPDVSSGTSRPATQIGAPSSDSASMATAAASPRNRAEVKNAGPTEGPPIKNDPPPQPAVVDASLRVSQAVICRSVENRMPDGVDRAFSTTDEKIYVWSKIEATQVPAKIRHIYYLGGKKISEVSLDVRSSPWRTWSSKTIADGRYRGEWRVDIAASNGGILRQLYFEVK